MQMYPRLFPRHRLEDPFRQAERRIFQALEGCGAPGLACYEWQRDRGSLHHRFSEGEWRRRRGRRGPYVRISTCLLAVTADATMSLLNEVSEALGKPNYFVPVLLFPDMDPDSAISARARRSNVHLVWRADPLLPRLAEIAREAGVRRPPGAEDIRREVAVITDGQVQFSEHVAVGKPEVQEVAPTASISAPGLLIGSAGRVRFHGRAPSGRAASTREVPDM